MPPALRELAAAHASGDVAAFLDALDRVPHDASVQLAGVLLLRMLAEEQGNASQWADGARLRAVSAALSALCEHQSLVMQLQALRTLCVLAGGTDEAARATASALVCAGALELLAGHPACKKDTPAYGYARPLLAALTVAAQHEQRAVEAGLEQPPAVGSGAAGLLDVHAEQLEWSQASELLRSCFDKCNFNGIVDVMVCHPRSTLVLQYGCDLLTRLPAMSEGGRTLEICSDAAALRALAVVLAALRAHVADAELQTGLLCVLRRLTNDTSRSKLVSRRALDAGAIATAVSAMRTHPQDGSVHRVGASLILKLLNKDIPPDCQYQASVLAAGTVGVLVASLRTHGATNRILVFEVAKALTRMLRLANPELVEERCTL